jgi:diguanylate cyclase (GGDEF)-like protein
MRSPAVFTDNFHQFHFRQSRWIIAAVFFVLGLNYFLSDHYPASTFGLSAEIPLGVIWSERGVIMPVSFSLALMLAIWGEKRWMERVVIVGALAVGCAMVTGRRYWQISGGDFSVDYSVYLPCALAALTAFGPRIWIIAAPMLLLNLGSAYYVRGVTPAAHFEAINIVAAATLVAAINWQLQRVLSLIWDERRHFESLSLTDSLTGLYNRRAFEERAHIAVRQALRERGPVVVVMVDLDCFKQYNDHYGHAAGDRVLQEVAAALSLHFRRPMDLVARMGGEEFAGLCFGVGLESAQQIGVDLVERIGALGIEHQTSLVSATLTASVGVHHAQPRFGQTLGALLHEADAALYAAKREGRNRAVATSH